MTGHPKSSRLRFRQSLPHLRQQGSEDGTTEGKNRGRGRRPSGALVAYVWGLLRGQRGKIALALLVLTISSVLRVVPPAATKLAVDHVFGERPMPEALRRAFSHPIGREQWLVILGSCVAVAALVGLGLRIGGQWSVTRTGIRLQLTMRRQLFEHTLRLPLDRIYELKAGGLVSLLREDAGCIVGLLDRMFCSLWIAAAQLVVYLAVLAWVDWRLLLAATGLLPLLYLSRRIWYGRIRPLHLEGFRQRQGLDGRVAEAFGGIRVARAFSAERAESSRFNQQSHLIARLEMLARRYTRLIEVIWGVLIPIAVSGLLVYGGMQVLNHQLTLGELMMFMFCLTMLLEPMSTLVNSWSDSQYGLAQLDRVLDILSEPQEMRSRHNSLVVNKAHVEGRISLTGVTFHYPGSEVPALGNINLKVESGQTVALIGPSGAGKTTLCNLIARFYDPTRGSVALNGTDLREIDVESYRKLLGIVDQDVVLFDGTISENIAYGLRNVSTSKIRWAAEIADAQQFIESLKDGYDTLVGERGVSLSGGQRQRVAIARAIIREPRILILDEATSDLDTESESRIHHSELLSARQRTCIVIAHRLSTVRAAERIIVIENGQIIESGTHDSLMAKSARYRQMVLAQTNQGQETL